MTRFIFSTDENINKMNKDKWKKHLKLYLLSIVTLTLIKVLSQF